MCSFNTMGIMHALSRKKTKEKLVTVISFNVSNAILESSILDSKMRIRLAGVSDLIAAEGKYHKTCLSSYKYATSKTKEEVKHTDLAMVNLCNELHYAADKRQILQF